MKYFIRSIKYLVFVVVFFAIVVTILFYTTTKGPNINTIWDLFRSIDLLQVSLFFIGVSAIYPLFGYYNKKIYVNDNFVNDKKQEIIDMMSANRYIFEGDENSVLTFRLRNKFLRFMRLYEDDITINYSGNPIVMSGLRKDVVRIGRRVEELALKENE